MKGIILIVLALTVATNGESLERRCFNENFYDFFDLIFEKSGPEINGLVGIYGEDSAFANAVQFLREQNYHLMLAELEGYEAFKQIFSYLRENGVDIEMHIDTLPELLFTPLSSEVSDTVTATGSGLYGFLIDFNEVIPYEQLKTLFNDKLATEELFEQTVNQLYSSEFYRLLDNLFADEAYIQVVNRFNDNGIDMGLVYFTLQSVLGNRPFEFYYKSN